ncbi:MAG: hypothetical protein MR215_00270 [Bacteroidales bacterium]|nr:hypothetical protein [Bacteroidales bacterium]MDD7725343.1 hypothetical protein [Bacteroidales bacterium]MDY4175277.1 hypothetical protein [Bacteroidales bacterium]
MIISCHLCLHTDGSFGRFPVAEVDSDGRVKSLTLNPEGPQEIGGMIFAGGVMLCGVPDGVRGVSATSREDFAQQMSAFGVEVGRGPLCVMRGADLNTFCGSFIKQSHF